MVDKGNHIEQLKSKINTVQYYKNAFTLYFSEDRIVIGAMFAQGSETDNFFLYGTVYTSILDADKKIKLSLHKALSLADDADFESWKPFNTPSEDEAMATYFTENAVFRIEMLWDLLAQWYNVKYHQNRDKNKIFASQLFHNCAQGNNSESFAKRVYEYMAEEDNTDSEPWQGNHKFFVDYRNKMTHRNSPNLTVVSNYDIELRMPIILVIERVIEEYWKVSAFITEFLEIILMGYTDPAKAKGVE